MNIFIPHACIVYSWTHILGGCFFCFHAINVNLWIKTLRGIFPQNHFKKFQQGLETMRFDVQLTSSSSPHYKLKITEEFTKIKYEIYVKHVLKPFTRQLIYESSIWKLRHNL